MDPISCLGDDLDPIVLDASVCVNLIASGQAERIIQSIPRDFIVTQPVVRELEDGVSAGHSHTTSLAALTNAGLVEQRALSDSASSAYVSLVSGRTIDTLDDGEAATIAYAEAAGAWAAIDERKARRICSERFKSVRRASTVEILADVHVVDSLTATELSEAVFLALSEARMRVLPDHRDWVIRCVGTERAKLCPSLPASVRSAL